jgi:broad specificity phosphatase PhoE
MKLNNDYFILRHGYSLRNKINISVSWPEKIYCPLLGKGIKQIEKAAQKIKSADLIFSSDLLRTKQTAEIIARKTKAKIIFDKRLREFDMGKFNGKPVSEAGKFWDKKGLSKTDYYLRRFRIRAPKGENYTDVKKRIFNFLKEINGEYKNKKIIIVSHELPLTVLEAAVKGLSQKETIEFREDSMIKTGELRKLTSKNKTLKNKN